MTSLRARTRRTAAVALAATGILAAPCRHRLGRDRHPSDHEPRPATAGPVPNRLDIAPVDVNFAAYPEGSTPPPDDRGLIPAAVFKFQTAKV